MKPKSGNSHIFVRVIATFFSTVFEVEFNFSLQHCFQKRFSDYPLLLGLAFSANITPTIEPAKRRNPINGNIIPYILFTP